MPHRIAFDEALFPQCRQRLAGDASLLPVGAAGDAEQQYPLRHGESRRDGLELARRFQSKEMLRLFLQSVGVSGLTPAVLLGTNRTGDLEAATEEIARDRSCPTSTGARRDCLLFGQGTAVSLMSAVTVNGKPETVPFGVSVGQILTGPAKGTPGDAIQTVSLSRRLVGGGYADVRFPRTLEGVQQIVLLPGDMLTW